MVYWRVKRRALLGYIARSLKASIVYRRAFVERVLVIIGTLLPYIVLSTVVSVLSFIVV